RAGARDHRRWRRIRHSPRRRHGDDCPAAVRAAGVRSVAARQIRAVSDCTTDRARMNRPPQAAAFQALNTRLTVPSTESWADRAYPDAAPANKTRPYALYWSIGGGYLPSRTGLRQAE